MYLFLGISLTFACLKSENGETRFQNLTANDLKPDYE